MNKPLRHVWLVVALLFLLLFGSTTYYQTIRQDELNAHGRNIRTVYNEFGKNRGPIVVDGEAIAYSVESNDQYGYQRVYPSGALYAPLTGYYSVVYGFSGIERALNDTLSGESDSLFYQRIADIVAGREHRGATVELTINAHAQQAAFDALGGNRGAVVALDPNTGAVLAMVSTPSFDPGQMASHSVSDVRDTWAALNNDPSRPLTNRAIGGDLYPPGSTFKLITAAAALEAGIATADTQIPGPGTYTLPGTSTVMNNHAGGDQTPCGPEDSSTLQEALRKSCNTSFAMLGVEVGEEALRSQAEEFGFTRGMQIPQGVTPSRIGEDLNDAQVATTSIGQYETRVTPLQMAMVAAAVANDGVIMKPTVVSQVRTGDLSVIESLSPQRFSQPLSAANAREMRTMMTDVVTNGTGRAAAIDGIEVGGKTGTAQWGQGKQPHAWFVGYAHSDSADVAIAVVVEEGGYGSQVAAPIARTVMEAVMNQ